MATLTQLSIEQQFAELPPAWHAILKPFINSPIYQQLVAFLNSQSNATIYPKNIFNALELTSPEQVKVIILGQDPYHGEAQANGLAFSVAPNIRIPPSLRNIYKEIQASLAHEMPNHGCLESWAKQGVLLLNTILTVEKAKPGSHAKQGWEECTNLILKHLNESQAHLVVMLWGAHAQSKKALFNHDRHCILEAPHPSPLSAYRGFLGCGHFEKANAFLNMHQLAPINWSLPSSPNQS